MTEQRWIFVIKIIKKPGALNSVTGVFSSWGIRLETTMLNAMGPDAADGMVILSFIANQRKMEILERTVRRLSKVTELKYYPYDTQKLRMIAACRVPAEYHAVKNENIEIEYRSSSGDSQLLYVSGNVAEVHAYLQPILNRNEILELVTTILTA